MAERSLAGAALLAAGLAIIPTAARADLRIEERSTTLDSTVTRWTHIKGNMRSIVTRAETTGVLYDAGAKYGAYVEIARPDKELIWELDPQERSYREIPAEQFTRLLQKGIQAPRSANEQPLRTIYRSETTAIEVAPTGKEKKIAGFNAEQVMARVVVGVQNQVSGNRFNFTFDQEIWLCKDPALVQEMRGFEEAYTEAFGSAATLQQAQVLAGEWSDAFITHLRAVNDRVRALQGVPLATTTHVTEEAVAQNKGEKGTKREFTVAATEVRAISMETLPDSEFELPVGYINSDTKVAVAPRLGGTPAPAPAAPVPVVKNDTPAAVAESPKPKPRPAAPVAAANPPPAKPAVPSPAPAPEPVKPVAAVVTAAPTNVIVPGTTPVPAPGARGKRKPGVVFIESYTAPAIDNHPILGGSVTVMTTRTAPPPVTIDEPVGLTEPRKKGKKKAR